MKAYRHIAAIATYLVIVLVSWNFSSVTGNAGDSDAGRQIVEKVRMASKAHLTEPCSQFLEGWSAATVRSRVAFEYPTSIGYRLDAKRWLESYAAEACPTGSLLIAGSLANSRAIEIRSSMGLARADLGSTIW